MTNYGFRLFWLEVKRNGRGESVPSDEVTVNEEKLHFREYLFDLAQSHVDDVVHGSPPRARDLSEALEEDGDASDEDTDDAPVESPAMRPVLMITEVALRGDHVVIKYVYGRQLGYTHAGFSEGKSESPVDIRNLKSVRPYRSVFILPGTGEGGVCAVEDASRTCPHKRLEQWLRHWARASARADEARKFEESGKKTQKTDWWAARFTPLSDPDRLSSLMKDGQSTRIVLTKRGGSDARQAGNTPLKVEMGLDDGPSLANARKVLTRWAPKKQGERPNASQQEANKELAAVLGEKYSGFDDEDYDDAWIDVRDADGSSKKISPSRWADIFTYSVQSRVVENPTSRRFFDKVMNTVKPLEKSLKIDIDWSGWGGDTDG